MKVKSLAAVVVLVLAVSAFPQSTVGVFTSGYNNQRTNENRLEPFLTLANVNQSTFGKIFSYSVDGQIYAQPLWVEGVSIPGQGRYNVVYVATQNDSVYAFDAQGKVSAPLWQVSFIDPANGVTPVLCTTNGVASCSVWPYFGITGTPVIDPQTNTMYVVARTLNANTQTASQTLHALDITTGAEKFGGPVDIEGQVPGTGVGSENGMVNFNPLNDIQRPALLLLANPAGEKLVYIGWAGSAHGWVMAYDATTLQQQAIFSTTPNAQLGGVWASGNGLASDSDGYIYFAAGDGPFDADVSGGDYGDSLLKVDSALNVVDYFSPMDQACRWQNDLDLGSSGPLVLPAQPGSHPEEILQTGKGGNPCDPTGLTPIYLVDRTNLGQYSAAQDSIVQEISGSPHGYWSSAAYAYVFNHQAVYLAGTAARAGVGDNLKMYLLSNGLLSTTPYAQSANIFAVGATPTVSSHNNKNSIVWAIERQDASGTVGTQPAILYAYNAMNLTTLYASNQNGARDQGGCGNKYAIPTVADGEVFVGTQNELDIFGLVGPQPEFAASLAAPCYNFGTQLVGIPAPPQQQTVTNTGSGLLAISAVSFSGVNAGDFSESDNCTSLPLSPGTSCSISITFTPQAVGPRIAYLMISDGAANNPQNAALGGSGQ